MGQYYAICGDFPLKSGVQNGIAKGICHAGNFIAIVFLKRKAFSVNNVDAIFSYTKEEYKCNTIQEELKCTKKQTHRP